MVSLGPAPCVEVVDRGERQQLCIDLAQAWEESDTLPKEGGDTLPCLPMDQVVGVVFEPVVQTCADPMGQKAVHIFFFFLLIVAFISQSLFFVSSRICGLACSLQAAGR